MEYHERYHREKGQTLDLETCEKQANLQIQGLTPISSHAWRPAIIFLAALLYAIKLDFRAARVLFVQAWDTWIKAGWHYTLTLLRGPPYYFGYALIPVFPILLLATFTASLFLAIAAVEESHSKPVWYVHSEIFLPQTVKAINNHERAHQIVRSAEVTGLLGELFAIRTQVALSLMDATLENLLSQARQDYRHLALSMGGNKLAVSVNDGNNKILSQTYVRWKSEFSDWQQMLMASEKKDSDAVMKVIIREVLKVLSNSGVDNSRVLRITNNLAGPLNEDIFGLNFPAPNLPFRSYRYRKALILAARTYGLRLAVALMNDAHGSLEGETVHPEGSLVEVENGGTVIIGGGVNIAVRKNAKMYYGPDAGVKEIYEAGHNLYQVKGEDEKIHFSWAGKKTQGNHPIELGQAVREGIINKSGAIGEEYVTDPAAFKEKYPDYAYIGIGMEDLEDRLSALRIRERLNKAINNPDPSQKRDANAYHQIAERMNKMVETEELPEELKEEVERALNPEAKAGNKIAIRWIKSIAQELGMALAAFIDAYQDEKFVRRLVLVSGINENLGKDVYESNDDEDFGLDIYIKTIRKSAIDELTNYFGMNEAKASEIVQGIVRSRTNYERELVSYVPSSYEVMDAFVRRRDFETLMPTNHEQAS